MKGGICVSVKGFDKKPDSQFLYLDLIYCLRYNDAISDSFLIGSNASTETDKTYNITDSFPRKNNLVLQYAQFTTNALNIHVVVIRSYFLEIARECFILDIESKFDVK